MTTTSRDRDAGQVQLQETAGASGVRTGAKLTRSQLNVLQTMITVIVCFIACWTPASLANAVQAIKVCLLTSARARLSSSRTNNAIFALESLLYWLVIFAAFLFCCAVTGSLDKKDNTRVNTGLNPFYQVTQYCRRHGVRNFLIPWSPSQTLIQLNHLQYCSSVRRDENRTLVPE